MARIITPLPRAVRHGTVPRMTKLGVLAVLCPLVVGTGCGKSDKPADKPGPTQPAAGAAGGGKGTAAKPVPGTEGLRSLLAGAGKNAAPSKEKLGGLGGILGGVGGGGMKAGGGGSADTAGVVGASEEGGTGTKTTTEEGRMGREQPAEPAEAEIKLPPPYPKGGDCAAVGKRMGDMTRLAMEAELATADEETKKMAAAMMDQMVAEIPKQMTQLCQASGWTQELRDCVLTAGNMAALEACERLVTPEMQAKMDGAEDLLAGGEGGEGSTGGQTEPKGPAPKWNGASNDCAAVGDHVVALATWQLSGDEDAAAAAAPMMSQIKDEVVKSCTGANWPEAARLCILKSSSIEAMDSCGDQLSPSM